MYIHQGVDWSNFTWNAERLSSLLAKVRYLQGCLLGRMSALGFDVQNNASFHILTQDIIKTSEIEGEILNLEQVRSSVAKKLDIEIAGAQHSNKSVDGIVEIMLDAVKHYNKPITKTRLCNWHSALFPNGRSGIHKITVGKWRGKSSGEMQVISGPFGREKVHYEAPSYDLLEKEMQKFIRWIEVKSPVDPIIKAAIAHLWFVTIHPFDDGNGRIARVIADMMLARSENTSHRFYSMSSEIERNRNSYYDILEKCQKGTSDITLWIEWFLDCLKRSIEGSEQILVTILSKAKFWEVHLEERLNERQRKVINLLLDGIEGKLTSSKWAKLTKCSQDTALRDITELLARNILLKEGGGGRSTSYRLIDNKSKGPLCL